LTQNHAGCESERFPARLRSTNLQCGQAVRIDSREVTWSRNALLDVFKSIEMGRLGGISA
jgi:hypothetical protein